MKLVDFNQKEMEQEQQNNQTLSSGTVDQEVRITIDRKFKNRMVNISIKSL